MGRRDDLERFYDLLGELSRKVGGVRCLSQCDGRKGWPQRGVYLFFEPGELREDGHAPRVVRVGTHAVRKGVKSTFWGRLAQHKGHSGASYPGGGNHRGSVFRFHVGTALLNTRTYPPEAGAHWEQRNKVPPAVKGSEYVLELDVSQHIGQMPFLWVDVPDDAGPHSDRGLIEAGTVALLSNYGKPPIDPPSSGWLGLHASNDKVRRSGLWNVNYVDGVYDLGFLVTLRRYVEK